MVRSGPGAQMFANRLRKNLDAPRAVGRDASASSAIVCTTPTCRSMRSPSTCTAASRAHVYLQEYAPPKTVDQESARERRREVLAALPDVLAVPLEQVHSRVRKPQKGAEQYEKRALDAGAARSSRKGGSSSG